ncbi:MAG TPA: hypothetical protein VKF38_09180 [Anaerolineaceae bacterium]|nr:hypothetical protein [Anaerolineaceae bacterium]
MNDRQIFKQLWSIFQNHKPVRLLNVFHGVPISYEATISMISQSYLGLSVHPYQTACIFFERYVYLQSEQLPYPIRAHAVSVDIGGDEVILERLVPVSNNFGNRINLRVQPKEPVPVEIRKNDESIIASLADLSLQGEGKITLGVLGKREFNLHQSQEVDLSLKMPFSNTELNICGVAGRHNFDPKKNLYRIKIQLTPDSSSSSILTDYISQRQTEIMQELDLMVQSMRKPHL